MLLNGAQNFCALYRSIQKFWPKLEGSQFSDIFYSLLYKLIKLIRLLYKSFETVLSVVLVRMKHQLYIFKLRIVSYFYDFYCLRLEKTTN
jgi:hypothetical protein